MRTFLPALLALASCTLSTDATDRKVDPTLARDLNYTFSKMDAHQTEALDIVLASEPDALKGAADGGVHLRLRAHARIVLPPIQDEIEYPDKTLSLRNAMDPGQSHLILFYADSDDDNQIDYGILDGVPGAEHIWRLDVPESGVDTFVHSTNFIDFSKSEYSPSGDVILSLTAPAPNWRPPACANGKDHTLEVRITIAPNGEDREIGYYRNYASNELPDKPIVLEDIADSNNTYVFEVLIDGELARPAFSKRAPDVSGQDLVIAQGDWYPTAPTTASCD